MGAEAEARADFARASWTPIRPIPVPPEDGLWDTR